MTDVFISYKRQEKARCERIADKLKALELDVWFDARLESGKSFDREIEHHVNAAKAVLVLWSPASAESEWVRNEATIGKERNVLVAAQIEPGKLPINFTNTHFETLHEADFADDHPGWLKLLERIGALTGRPSLADFSRTLGSAGRPLREWAAAHPGDPLAKRARELADQVGQLSGGGARSAYAAPQIVRRGGAGLAVAAAAVAAVVGGAGAWVLKPQPASAAGSTPLQQAVSLVGDWNVTGEADGCKPPGMTVAIASEGVVINGKTEALAGVSSDGWIETDSGAYRRQGDKLQARGKAAGDAVAEWPKC